MPHVSWTRRAFDDVIRLEQYLQQFSVSAAKRAMNVIESGIAALQAQPESGRLSGPGQREWILRFGKGAYIVTYRVHLGTIYIVAVRHSREQRLPPPL